MKAKFYVKNHPADVEMYKENEWEEEKVKANRDAKRKKLRPTTIAPSELLKKGASLTKCS